MKGQSIYFADRIHNLADMFHYYLQHSLPLHETI